MHIFDHKTGLLFVENPKVGSTFLRKVLYDNAIETNSSASNTDIRKATRYHFSVCAQKFHFCHFFIKLKLKRDKVSVVMFLREPLLRLNSAYNDKMKSFSSEESEESKAIFLKLRKRYQRFLLNNNLNDQLESFINWSVLPENANPHWDFQYEIANKALISPSKLIPLNKISMFLASFYSVSNGDEVNKSKNASECEISKELLSELASEKMSNEYGFYKKALINEK
ncbi:sulfotransferase family 2 domain-containing protein [Glaciecola sp. MH2013]|uniref:sulfotransferase family 2 domain-containing protein n=1 Tax=Glaciecola sp. MH2013 TaxID=2785524 RepID=UPI0018A09489|nr:sulfotransferase family 2 domain-containing protein [Glaciecola sp. MH2013]MBF7072248.1 sulfotransferase family 2 domain-containing protein [Glaciecola sp. MH2013]